MIKIDLANHKVATLGTAWLGPMIRTPGLIAIKRTKFKSLDDVFLPHLAVQPCRKSWNHVVLTEHH